MVRSVCIWLNSVRLQVRVRRHGTSRNDADGVAFRDEAALFQLPTFVISTAIVRDVVVRGCQSHMTALTMAAAVAAVAAVVVVAAVAVVKAPTLVVPAVAARNPLCSGNKIRLAVELVAYSKSFATEMAGAAVLQCVVVSAACSTLVVPYYVAVQRFIKNLCSATSDFVACLYDGLAESREALTTHTGNPGLVCTSS